MALTQLTVIISGPTPAPTFCLLTGSGHQNVLLESISKGATKQKEQGKHTEI